MNKRFISWKASTKIDAVQFRLENTIIVALGIILSVDLIYICTNSCSYVIAEKWYSSIKSWEGSNHRRDKVKMAENGMADDLLIIQSLRLNSAT